MVETTPVSSFIELALFSASTYLFTRWKKRKSRKQNELLDDQFLLHMPKVELHVHLDGSFEFALLNQHLNDLGHHDILPESVQLPWHEDEGGGHFPVRQLVQDCQDYNEFHALCTCVGKSSLREMIKCFEVFVPIVRGNLELMEELAYHFVKRQAEQNIIYTEVRYSPHVLAKGATYAMPPAGSMCPADPVPIVDAVTRGLIRGENDFGVKVNQILCCIAWRPDWAEAVIQLAHERRSTTDSAQQCAIVGVDIAAGEEHFDVENFPHLHYPHKSAFQLAQELDLNITLHAGEFGDATFIHRAITEYGAVRIGHGYRMMMSNDDADNDGDNAADYEHVIQTVIQRNVHVEVCPTSSLETGAWTNHQQCPVSGECKWEEHPFVKMRERGVRVGLNSDDPAVFDTSLVRQYDIALRKMGLSRGDIVEGVMHSIDASFLSDEEKDDVREKMLEFVRSHG